MLLFQGDLCPHPGSSEPPVAAILPVCAAARACCSEPLSAGGPLLCSPPAAREEQQTAANKNAIASRQAGGNQELPAGNKYIEANIFYSSPQETSTINVSIVRLQRV